MASFLQLQKTILSFFFLLSLLGNTQMILAQAAPGGVSSGLEFWVKADSGVYEDISTSGGSVDATEEGDVVEAWHDVSGNGYHLDDSQTGTPTYRALSINYNPSVEFDGNGDFLEWNENNIPWFEADNELTIYSVVDADVMGTRGWIDTETADDSSEQLFISQRNGENGTFNIGADGTGGPNYLVTDTDIRTTDPMIIGFTYDGGESTANTIYDAFIDGLEYSIAGTNTASGTISTNVDKFSLGNGESGAGNEDWDGLISEVFTYDRVLTPTERRQVESYLAIKYGKTLDQTTPTDYLASDGTTNPWANDADGYDSDIFGIGRDDDSALNQKISTSVNSGSILTIALEEDFTSENSAAGRTIVHANDKQFAMVAHNGAATTTQTTELDVTSGFNLRLAREWKIDATNFNQSVSVKFEGFDETWTVIATVDGDFSSNVEIVGSLNANGELTTPNPPADGTVFTLAKFQKAPGGVSTGLKLWLKADTGFTYNSITDAEWLDQSTNVLVLNSNLVQGPDSDSAPTFLANHTNFNPAIVFDGVDNGLASALNVANFNFSETTAFSVQQVLANTTSESNAIWHYGATGGNDFALFAYPDDYGFHVALTGGLTIEVTNDILNNDLPNLFGFTGNSSSTELYVNDKEIATSTAMTTLPGNGSILIGLDADGTQAQDGDNHLEGAIGEIIMFDRKLSTTEQQQVNSYLALKYGLALDQTTATDYIASDGTTVIWDASGNIGYTNNILGIGRDDDSGLDQKVSKSVNQDAILTIALDADFTSENGDVSRTTTHTNNKQFAMVAHNGAATTIQNTEIDAASGFNLRLAREWKIDATNFNQSVSVKFEGFDETWTVIATVDGDFSSNVEIVGSLNADGELTTPNPPADGTVFTLAKYQKAPGGVTTGIALWISSDQQVFSDLGSTNAANNDEIVQWNDQSSNSNDFTQTNPEKPTFLDNSINFNPQVYFDGTQAMDALSITGMPSGSNARLMRVVATQTAAFTGNHVPFGHGVETDSQANVLAGSSTNNSLIYGSWGAVNDITSTTFWELDVPHIIGGGYDGVSTSYLQADGATLVSDTDGAPPTWNTVNTRMRIGADIALTTGQFWTGNIAEVIVYDADITGAEQQKIDSYLAIKYGITIPTDYLASDGSTIWDASNNTGFVTDIFGIGRDDDSSLNQKVSKSINPGSILIVALDNDYTSSNNDGGRVTEHANDLQYFTLSNNGNDTSAQFTEVEESIFNIRTSREWKVDKTTNFSQTVNLKFEGFDDTWKLFKDADGDFTSGAIEVGTLNASGEITGVTLADGEYFTLAKLITVGPGGVFGGLQLWLKSEAGYTYNTSTDAEWLDQSPSGLVFNANLVQGPDTDSAPTFLDNAVNFNPGIIFDGVDTGLATAVDAANFDFSEWSIFSVQQTPDTNSKAIWHYGVDGQNTLAFFIDSSPSQYNFTVNNSVAGSNIATPLIDDNIPHIVGLTNNIGSGEAYVDSDKILDFAGQGQLPGDGAFLIGLDADGAEAQDGDNHFLGGIGEVLMFNKKLTDLERQEVQSYLAIKYGVTQNQTTATNYIASDGTTNIWENDGDGYDSDIFGIGRDDNSALSQKVSKSMNPGSILTIALDNDFTSSNTDAARTISHINDLQFLAFASNGGATSVQYNEIDGTSFNTRIAREWKVDKTANFSHTINLRFEGFDDTWTLLKDADGDFSAGVTSLGTLDTNGEITGITLVHDEFLTLAKLQEAPGGVLSNNQLWLKADKSTFSDRFGNTKGSTSANDGEVVASWGDQSDTRTNDATDADATLTGPTLDLSNPMNYNPVLNFDGAGVGYTLGDDYLYSSTNGIAIIAVARSSASASGVPFLYDFGFHGNDNHFLYHRENNTGFRGPYDAGGGSEASYSYTSNTKPTLITANIDFGSDHTLFLNGVQRSSQPNTLTTMTSNEIEESSTRQELSGPVTIGIQGKTHDDVNRHFEGDLAELIIYDQDLDDISGTARKQIESYLALKYGIALDQTASNDYLASNGATIWSATNNVGYATAIFGIGRDDASGLNQKVATSMNTDAILIAALDADFTVANIDVSRTTVHTNDKQFMFLANNNGAITTQTTEIDGTTFNTRIEREWKVDKTANFSQSVNLKFEGFDETWTLLKDSDGDFSTGATSLGTLDANGEITGVTLADGDFLTLAKLQEAPGGQFSDLTIWLKADTGTKEAAANVSTNGATIDQWDNQIINSFTHFMESELSDNATLLTNVLNFNPVIDIDDDDRMHVAGGSNAEDYLDNDSNSAYIIYTQNSDVSGADVIFQFENGDVNERFNLEGNPVHFGSPSSSNSVYATTSFVNGNYNMLSLVDTNTSNGDTNTMYINGAEDAQITNAGDIDLSSGKLSLGAQDANTNHSDINIAEFILFKNEHDDVTRGKIETYLAIKYGFSLDQSIATNYTASNDAVIWSATNNTGYSTDIFGIGRDDNSGLDQKISRSINDATGPILATIQDFTAANNDGGRSSLDNGNFIILGHDNSVNTFTASYNGGTNNRLSRVWKVSETGTVGNIYFAVPYAAYTFPSGGAPSVVISNDTTFDDADETIVLTYDRASGMYSAQINPADGDYITLVTSEISLTTPAYYRGSSGGDGNTTTDGVTRYGTYSDFITDTNGVYASFSQHWSFGDSFFADGIYFYRTNNVISEIVRYPSIEDLGANTNGVIFNLSQTWNTTDEFFASGDQFFRTNSSGTGTFALTAYPSFEDLVANMNGISSGNFSTEYAFADQFFHDGQYFCRTSISGGNHISVSRYKSLPDLVSGTVLDTQAFGPWNTNDDIYAVGITAGYTVSETALTFAESAGTGTFTVVLDAKPTSDVVFDISSDDTDEATVSPAQLTFTTANWDSAQTITVTGVNDDIDRDDSATITVSVNDAGSDDTFNTLDDETVTITLTDDDMVGYTLNRSGFTIDEDAGSDTFTVVLDSEPTSGVVLDISSDDTDEVTVSPAQLTFTTANWDSAQTITVTGVNDDIDRDDSATITVTVNDAGSDDTFETLDDETVTITLTDDDMVGYTLNRSSFTIDEDAGSDTFTVVLDSEPTSDVVLDISSDDTDEATVSPAQLTFTTANWDSAQTITVTGVNDDIDRDDSATITVTVNDAGSDNTFDALDDETVTITLTDDDMVGYTLNRSSFTIDEDAGSDTFTVVLDSEPTSDVVLDISSDDTDEATVSPAQLTFTTANWDSAQTITVTGVNDDIDRDDSATITVTVNDAGSDNTFDALDDETVTITLTDDDMVGYTLNRSGFTIDEDAGSDTFTVVLDSEPTSGVVLDISSDDTDEATVSPAQLTFTTANWDSAQTITVTGVNDDIDRDDSATITVTVNDAGSDNTFDALDDETVTITLTDDDMVGYTLNRSSFTIDEDAGSDTFTVVLDSEPTSDVVLDISSDDTDEATVSPAQLTFTTANWDSAQTITVTGVNDDIERDDIATITVTVNDAGSDDTFETLDDETVTITLTDDDVDTDGDGIIDPNDNCSTLANSNQLDTDSDGQGNVCDTDDDDDGVLDVDDDFPLDENEDTDTDGDGTGDNADTDDDGDGVLDVDDDFPLDENEDTDTDGDGTGDNADTDDDDDGVLDVDDDFPLDENEDTDTDGDGTGDNADIDDDGDGIPDNEDPDSSQLDTDGDGIPDATDTDDDGDGVLDVDDDFPLDENEDTDTDGDGTGDNADTDDDDDGVPDVDDDFPLDENEDTDTDGDGTGDNADTDDDGDGVPDVDDDFPLDENEDTDTDGDGTGDNADTDDDGDGVPDVDDDFPLDENEDTDTDGDGTGDNADTDDDGDGVLDVDDDFPLDENEDTDTDGDGTGDNADIDDDGDGIPDTEDPDSSQLDTDGDGIPDATDTDDDGDGVLDVDDDFPLDENEDTDTDGDGTGDNADIDDDGIPDTEDPDSSQLDTDGDGIPDVTDTDDDGDGVPDVDDDFPLDENEDTDTDGDGTGDNADIDDDGIPDTEDPDSTELDTDGDGIPDATDTDDDGDGVPDAEDDFPLDENEDTDTDGDGTGDNADMDDDGDGLLDVEDVDVNGDGIPDNGTDTDGDGINNANDNDWDNDGVPNEEDAFPNDPAESVDADGDGIGANEDLNDSNSNIGRELPIEAAQAFTPNGDNINDTWIVKDIDNYPNSIVTVYNRYGHEVFKAIGYKNDWDGRYKSRSEKLPPGSYYFTIDLKNGKAPIDGWLFINY